MKEEGIVDPVTAAIVAALAVGVAGGAGKVGEKILVDAYEALKKAIKHKLGADSTVAKAVESLEAKPDSTARRQVLNEEVTAANIDKDHDILKGANDILDYINSQPSLAQHVQNAVGQYIAQADRGSTANVNVNQPKNHQ
jgi:hypothetical protein